MSVLPNSSITCSDGGDADAAQFTAAVDQWMLMLAAQRRQVELITADLSQREINLRAYEERLLALGERRRAARTYLVAAAAGSAAPHAVPVETAAHDGLNPARDRLNRAQEILEAEQAHLRDDRLVLRDTALALQQRDALVQAREEQLQLRETALDNAERAFTASPAGEGGGALHLAQLILRGTRFT